MKHAIILFLVLLIPFRGTGQNEANEDGVKLEKKKMEKTDYIPEIHGTIRAKYEYQPEINASRFEVRNARFSLTGNVHSSVAYKAEIDLSDEGSIKMLDAYTRLFPIKSSQSDRCEYLSQSMHIVLPINNILPTVLLLPNR